MTTPRDEIEALLREVAEVGGREAWGTGEEAPLMERAHAILSAAESRGRETQGERCIPESKVRQALEYNEKTAEAPSYMRADEASAFENGWAAAIRLVEDRLGMDIKKK